MLAIYKKELKSYLTSMIGFVFMFFILLITGIYFTGYNLSSGYSVIGNTLSAITFIFIVAMPILTMRVLAEERRMKTDQLLLTAPISVTKVVMGKFFAMITIYLIPMVIIGFYPIILKSFGTVSLKMAYTSIFGFYLLGSACIAVGMFFSAITESQIIAAVLSFIVLLAAYMESGITSFFGTSSFSALIVFIILVLILAYIIYLMSKTTLISYIVAIVGIAALCITYAIKSSLFENGIQNFFSVFNITDHLDNFVNGIFDLSGLIYFVSVMVIFLFLTIQSILKRRWS